MGPILAWAEPYRLWIEDYHRLQSPVRGAAVSGVRNVLLQCSKPLDTRKGREDFRKLAY